MYCPVCLNNTLSLKDHGVLKIEINTKHRDNNIFLYDLKKESELDLHVNLQNKVDDFLRWYSSFQNKEPIKSFTIFSQDFSCSGGCSLPVNLNLSVIGILFQEDDIYEILAEGCAKYGLELDNDVEMITS